MKIVLFNEKPEVLIPFTLLRPTYDVPVGGITLRQWCETVFPDDDIIFHEGLIDSFSDTSGSYLAMNGKLLPTEELANFLKKIISEGEDVEIKKDDQLVTRYVEDNEQGSEVNLPDKITLLQGPWDIIKNLALTLSYIAKFKKEGLRKVREGVFAGEGVNLEQTVVTRADNGPIMIGKGARLGALVVLEGPLIIGENCIVRDHAVIARSSIGDVCKVGGEVEDSIINSYSNKQHYGFLGHSIIDSWVNLGAGTTTSDLKHTYGSIKVDCGDGRKDTGSQFIGSFIGQGSKTAINTSLMAGSIVGAHCFLFGTVNGYVPSFTSLTRNGLMEMPVDIALRTLERVMKRRELALDQEQRAGIELLFQRTQEERKLYEVHQGSSFVL